MAGEPSPLEWAKAQSSDLLATGKQMLGSDAPYEVFGNTKALMQDYAPANFDQRFAPANKAPLEDMSLPPGATQNEGKIPVELLQQITAHPEFSGLIQTIVDRQMAEAARAASQISANRPRAPAPAMPAAADPFQTRVPGKDQERVVSARYPGDR